MRHIISWEFDRMHKNEWVPVVMGHADVWGDILVNCHHSSNCCSFLDKKQTFFLLKCQYFIWEANVCHSFWEHDIVLIFQNNHHVLVDHFVVNRSILSMCSVFHVLERAGMSLSFCALHMCCVITAVEAACCPWRQQRLIDLLHSSGAMALHNTLAGRALCTRETVAIEALDETRETVIQLALGRRPVGVFVSCVSLKFPSHKQKSHCKTIASMCAVVTVHDPGEFHFLSFFSTNISKSFNRKF